MDECTLTYSPLISQTRKNCPHTYGVRVCSCAAFATESRRPTACISLARHSATQSVTRGHDQFLSCGGTSSNHCSLITAHSSHTFSAKERDAETGLSYFGSRYYSSDLGIWLSVDPMSDKYPSMSPYVYCADNPVKLTDPDGRWIPGVDDDNNIIVTQEEGDDINSFKKFMGTAYSDEEIQNMYNGLTENGIINLTKTYGREFQIMTDALNDAYNNPDFENCKNYNCWGMAIAVTKCIQVQGNGPDDCWGISFNLNDFEHFDNSLSMGYVQGGCESASVGKTVVRFGRNESDHPHGAVYMGTDRSGTEYVFTKNGWTVRPELSTTETMLFENGYGGNCDRSGRAGQGYYTRTIKSRKRNR